MTSINLIIWNFMQLAQQQSMQLLEYYYTAVSKRRRRIFEMLLRFLITTTPQTTLLDIGPLLRLKRDRRFWMKNRNSEWWEKTVNIDYMPEDWIETFRMTKATFEWICEQLKEDLKPKDNYIRTREPVSVEKQVAIALCFLASCSEYRMVGYGFGVHKSTVWKCVHRVVDSINRRLMGEYLNMPDEAECNYIASQFEIKSHIPQICGAIDGTHIPILPPSDGYRDFVNRKGWPSVVLQAVVDHKYRFRNVNCQAPGACHDASVLRRSGLFKNHNDLIPKKTKTVLGVEIPFMIIGDPAYPLLPWFMKGYKKCNRLTPEEESFNVYLNSARVYVEIAFDRLKSRWRCLMKRLDIHYSFVPNVVIACCILHNIVEIRKEVFIPAWENAVTDADLQIPQPPRRPSVARENIEATEIRTALKDYLSANFPLRKTF